MDKLNLKTEQTIKALLNQCEKIGYGELTVKLIIHENNLVGFDQEVAPLIRFRAVKEGGKK